MLVKNLPAGLPAEGMEGRLSLSSDVVFPEASGYAGLGGNITID
jgi:hypothetical protein